MIETKAIPQAAAKWLRAFWIGIPAVYAVLLLLAWNRVGLNDHDQLLSFHSLQYWNWKLFGLAKQWTPVLCGGFSIAGDPQVPVFSLAMLLGYVLGPHLGIRLAIVVYFVMGWVGAYLYAGLLDAGREYRVLAASLFIGNGFFVARLGHGHVTAMQFLILPLVLWLLHQSVRSTSPAARLGRVTETGAMILGLSVILAMALDSSPLTVLHFLPWCGVYALTLSFETRRLTPILVFGAAVAGAASLDAAYLLPVVVAQASFPRILPDTFTNPFLLLWFMVLPIRGKILPAPEMGHEMTVFAGPIIVWLIFKHRQWLRRLFPSSLALPLLVTSVVAVWLGMGSLAAIGVPEILSPFDWLRGLPGFKSMGATARFWGFIALPLALLGAAALSRTACQMLPRKFRTLAIALFLFQFGFQIESVSKYLLFSERYVPADTEGLYEQPETIEFVSGSPRNQALVVTPTRCLVDCYNDHDFIRPPMQTGQQLVVAAWSNGERVETDDDLDAVFVDWSTIRLRGDPVSSRGAVADLTLVLNQAYHPLWTSDAGEVTRGADGNLVVESISREEMSAGVELRFYDPASARGVSISKTSWGVAAILAALLGPLWLATRPRSPRRRLETSPPPAGARGSWS